jgi:hypothetical protein
MNDSHKIVEYLLSIDSHRYPHHKFYLGGSRRMNERDPELIPINTYTDYDLYIDYTPEAYQYLIGIGFQKTSTEYEYFDDNAVCVMSCRDIQVVMRKDASTYKKVFESITPKFYHRYVWKSGPYHPDNDQIREIINQLLATGA